MKDFLTPNLILSFAQFLCSIYYAYCLPIFLSPKQKFRSHLRLSIFFILFAPAICFQIIRLFTTFQIPAFLTLFYHVTAIFVSLLFFEDSISKKILLPLIIYLSGIALEAIGILVLNLCNFFLPQAGFDTSYIQNSTDLKSIFIFFLVEILVGCLLCFFYNKTVLKFFYLIDNIGPFLKLVLPFFVVLISYNVLSILSDFFSSPILYLLFSFFFFFLDLGIFLLFLRMHKKENEILLTKQLKQQQYELCTKESIVLNNAYSEIRKWNHDIGNHLISIEFLLENGEYERAKSYMEQLLINNKNLEEPS